MLDVSFYLRERVGFIRPRCIGNVIVENENLHRGRTAMFMLFSPTLA